jgi:hypothetical protein
MNQPDSQGSLEHRRTTANRTVHAGDEAGCTHLVLSYMYAGSSLRKYTFPLRYQEPIAELGCGKRGIILPVVSLFSSEVTNRFYAQERCHWRNRIATRKMDTVRLHLDTDEFTPVLTNVMDRLSRAEHSGA